MLINTALAMFDVYQNAWHHLNGKYAKEIIYNIYVLI